MRALRSWFGVGEKDQPPFLQDFNSVQELLHVYQYEIPESYKREKVADTEGGDVGSGTGKKSSEDQQLEILAEAIGTATKVKSGVAAAENEDYVANSASEAATGKESVDNPYEGENIRVAMKFRNVLESESLRDVVSACEGALNALVLKWGGGVRRGWLGAEVQVAAG